VSNDNAEVIIVDDGSWDKLNTYIDEYGQEVCPLTDVSCQALFLNAQEV
jgi:glycosyltransferase involved in cell wall biosynthesis